MPKLIVIAQNATEHNRMYKSHMKQTSTYALSSADNLADTALMVVLSIRQHWHRIGGQLNDVRAKGANSVYLFSHKKACYLYLQENKERLYRETIKNLDDREALLNLWLDVPFLGLVKAGFVVQLATGHIGCIDSHNLTLYNIPLNTVTFNKKVKPATRAKRIKAYIEACDTVGGSLSLWTNWCELMANKYTKHFTNAEHVSILHVDYLKG